MPNQYATLDDRLKRANALISRRRFDEAGRLLDGPEIAAVSDPSDLFRVAMFFIGARRWHEGQERLERVIELDPDGAAGAQALRILEYYRELLGE